jgi:hypothetical protein
MGGGAASGEDEESSDGGHRVNHCGGLRGGADRGEDEYDSDDSEDDAPAFTGRSSSMGVHYVRQRDGSVVPMDETTRQMWLAQQKGKSHLCGNME